MRFLLFKGPGSFKKSKKFAEMWGIYGPSIDTTHTPPLFSFYTTFKYYFIFHPSDFPLSEDAGLEPKTIATLAWVYTV
jgi:hypothetical protein